MKLLKVFKAVAGAYKEMWNHDRRGSKAIVGVSTAFAVASFGCAVTGNYELAAFVATGAAPAAGALMMKTPSHYDFEGKH